MRNYIVFLVTMSILLSGCSSSLEKEDHAVYRKVGLISLVQDQFTFTLQGPFPIQIKQKAEDIPNWKINDHIRTTSNELIGHNFELIELDYDSAALNRVFQEQGFPGLTAKQKSAIRKVIHDKPVDAIVLLENGGIALGQIHGVIEGLGVLRRDMYLIPKSVQIHAIFSGRVFDATDFEPLAYHDTAISAFKELKGHPWSFGFSGMTEQAKLKMRHTIKESSKEALQKVMTKLGLVKSK